MSDLTEYYKNLLIIQYNNKEKAKATIELLVDELWASDIYQSVRDGYNIDTAVGLQLDIIGKYVGLTRFYSTNQLLDDYFGFADAQNMGGTASNIVGFDDAASLNKTGFFLDANEVISNEFELNDATFRTLIKLRIVQNNSNHDMKSITDSLFQFFGNTIIAVDNYNMTMSYLIGDVSNSLIEAAIVKGVLPKPAAVRIEAINGNQFYGFADATNLDNIPEYISGFNDAVTGFTQDGRFLNANTDII